MQQREKTSHLAPPSGVATFLFTDIEGSTWLVQHLGDGWDAVLHEHNRLLRDVWRSHDGYEVSTDGDAFFVAFAKASDAFSAALDAQRRLAEHRWPMADRLRVRIGIHTGEARLYGTDYVGLAVHQAARVQSAAHGGQVIVTAEARDAAGPGFDHADLGIHRLKDLSVPVRLLQLVDPSRSSNFPAPRTLTVMPNNFPVQSTTFIGREDDIAELRVALDASRLLTLTGAGGVGKTRLALQLGAEVIDDYADGAWLADLAPLADRTGVVALVAGVLGVREQPGREFAITLIDHLIGKEMLIVLDNCEHVIDASADITHRILSACPKVKVLATSREALNVAGEHSHRMRSLVVPDVEGDGAATASGAESVRLFAQRARSVKPSFEVTNDNVGAVAQICQRLDGLPLAIELAAARVGVMSVKEIAERLDDRFRLLTGGTRVALPRQRTLEATVSWSYDLLTESDRSMFDELSVFSGGWSLAGAEHVCRTDDGDVMDCLGRFVDRSLVVAEETADGNTRYRLLETLRQFGRDRLLTTGRVRPTRDRHLAWMVALGASLPPQTGARLPPEVSAESENLRAALDWSIEAGDHASGLLILADVWNFGAHVDERARWYEGLLPSVDRVPTDVAARLYAGAGGLYFTRGDWERSAELNHNAATAARASGAERVLSLALLYEGASNWGMQRDADAFRLIDEGFAVARRIEDREMIRRSMAFKAWAMTYVDLDEALELAVDLDEQSQREGTPFDLAHAREVLGWTLALRGDLDRALRTTSEAALLFDDVFLSCSAHALETTAAVAGMSGHPELGAELWGAADRLRQETADKPRPWERAVQEIWLPKVKMSLDEPTFDAAWLRGQSMERESAISYAAGRMSRLVAIET